MRVTPSSIVSTQNEVVSPSKNKRNQSLQEQRIRENGITVKSSPLNPDTIKVPDQNSMPVVVKINRTVSDLFDTTKKYSGIVGAIYSLVGKSVYIEGKYYNKTSLTKRVLTVLTNENVAHQFKRTSTISKHVNYYIKQHGGMDHFIEYMDKQHNKIQEGKLVIKISGSPTELEVLRTLDHIDPSKITQLEWSNDTKNLEKHLRPGDIIFFQNTELFTKHVSPRFIMRGQLLAKLWLKGKTEPIARTYTHLGIYIGNGKFAEAVPGKHGNDVRILPLSRLELHAGDEKQYKICRPQDKKMAKKAARLASKYAQDKSEAIDRLNMVKKKGLFKKDPLSIIPQLEAQIETKARYSRLKAAGSLFGNANFSNKVKKEVLHQILELSHNAAIPKNKKGKAQDFFCSHFVAECMQRGNVLQLLPIIKKLAKDRKIDELPDINGPNGLKLAKKWVNSTLKKCPDIWDKLAFQYSTEYVSPQKFRSIVSTNPELFRDIYTIIPPSKT